MLIRRYQPQDIEAIKSLHYAGVHQIDPTPERPDNPFADADLDDIEGVYLGNGGDFIIGIEREGIVAMGGIRKYSETCGEIKRIRVRRDYQRKGYGETILQKLIEIAGKLGYKELCLDTLADNFPAQSLFEKIGFIETDRGNIGTYDLIYYGKKLKEGG